MKKILLSEWQYKNLCRVLCEGVDWSNNGDGSVNLSINQDKTDVGNAGANSVDTRMFGTRDAVLNGDGTIKNSLSNIARTKQATIQYYQNVINFVKNGRKGNFEASKDVPLITLTSVAKWFDEGKSDNWIIDKATKSIERITNEANPYISTFNRVSSNDSEKVARYKTGTVQGTDVKYIALFTMTDFNFSDAIKHGTVRQNGNIDNILGITKDQRERGNKGTEYAPINVTYDNRYIPDISQNFSLKNVKDGHFKQQFGLNGEGGYSTISQYLDKSVNYASYALKQEGFIPDFIVAPPSSSKFNKYYCINLSRKLGIPFRDDFFKRNIINVKFDKGRDTQEMLIDILPPLK